MSNGMMGRRKSLTAVSGLPPVDPDIVQGALVGVLLKVGTFVRRVAAPVVDAVLVVAVWFDNGEAVGEDTQGVLQ